MAMAMEALDAFRQLLWQVVGKDAETAARRTRIVYLCLNLAVLGIDPHATRDAVANRLLIEAIILGHRVEGDVARTFDDGLEVRLFIGGRIGMCLAAELLIGQRASDRLLAVVWVMYSRKIGKVFHSANALNARMISTPARSATLLIKARFRLSSFSSTT